MKTSISRTKGLIVLAVIVAGTSTGCFKKMSESVEDESAGMNGGFEVTRSGLPVNWLVYAPTTIPQGDYELIIDTVDPKEGKQSLKFLVQECLPTGGWHSPGISQEYSAVPGKTYRVSFWVKNEGSEFRAQIGGVSAFEGKYHTVVESGELIPDWKKIEYEYKMPMDFETIRFELNVLKPGSFWIDDIKIEKIEDM